MSLLSPRSLLLIVIETIEGFIFHRGFRAASDIAVSGFIAFFPFLIFVASLSHFLRSPSLFAVAERSMFVLWPTEIARPLVEESSKVIDRLGGEAAAFSLLISIWLTSNALEAVRDALDDAYEIVERRNWWQRRAESLMLVIMGAAFLLALAWLVSFLTIVPEITFEPLAPRPISLVGPVQSLSGLAIYLVILIVCHRRLVHGGRRFLPILPGVVLTLVFSGATAYGFAWWTSRIVNYQTTYGSLALALATLALFVLIAATVVLGAEFNAAIERVRNDEAKGPRLLSWSRF